MDDHGLFRPTKLSKDFRDWMTAIFH